MTDYKKMYEDMKAERDQLLLSINKINDDQSNLPPIAHTIDKLNLEYDNLDNQYNDIKIKYNKIKINNQTNINKAKELEFEKNTIISSMILTQFEQVYFTQEDNTFYITLPNSITYKKYNNKYTCNCDYVRDIIKKSINFTDKYNNYIIRVSEFFEDGKYQYEIDIVFV